MKKMQIISWTLFLVGIVFGFLHFPGGAMMRTFGALLLLIHSIIYLCKNIKTNLLTTFLNLSYSFLTACIVSRINYWDYLPTVFFIIGLVITGVYFVLFIKNKVQFNFPNIFLLVYLVLSLILLFDKVYYSIFEICSKAG